MLATSTTDNELTWFDNTSGNGTTWVEARMAPQANLSALVTADFDNDGDLDEAASPGSGFAISWYPNRGGQLGSATSSDTTNALDGATLSVLAIDASHEGRPGDAGLELTDLGLLFEEAVGDPLSSAEANALIVDLELWVDDGDLLFSSGSDTLVTTVSTLSLTAGVQAVALADADPNVALSAGQTRRCFAVLDLAADASTQTPSRFILTHRSESDLRAEDASLDLVASVAFEADTSAGPIVPLAAGADADSDGLTNSDELLTHSTDPLLADSDADGLSDDVEVAGATDANDLDSDGDDFLDSVELHLGSSPTSSGSVPSVPVRIPFAAQPAIATGIADVEEIDAGDLDGDGDLDLLAASEGISVGESVVWIGNADGTGGTWSAAADVFAVPTGMASARAGAVADLDGDGDLDAVAAWEGGQQWAESDLGDATSWTERTIALPGAWPDDAIAADMDGDGDLDVLAARDTTSTLAGYENDDGAGGSFTLHTVDASVANAETAAAIDIDEDGDVDVVGSSRDIDSVLWWENLGGGRPGQRRGLVRERWIRRHLEPASRHDRRQRRQRRRERRSGPGRRPRPPVGVVRRQSRPLVRERARRRVVWLPHTTNGSYTNPIDLLVADVDGDGDLDIATAAGGDDAVYWDRNDTIHRSAAFPDSVRLLGAPGGRHERVVSADLDGDGDLDAAAPDRSPGRVNWHENLDGNGTSWSTAIVATPFSGNPGAMIVDAGDLDRDGDVDLLASAQVDHRITWHENLGGTPVSWNTQIIMESADSVTRIRVADIDGDGDVDFLTSGLFSVTLHPNRGGQFALPTTDVAYQGMVDGQEREVLEIDSIHRGRTGDSDAEIATLELRFEDDLGVPLTSAQANALISLFTIHLDDGDGVLEIGVDTVVATLTPLVLSAGVQTQTFSDGAADVQVPEGLPKMYFAVAQLAADASMQTPSAFQVFHLTESSSTAEDRDNDIPLALEFEADTGTGAIQALAVGGDADSDGLENQVEADTHGTDPLNADTDGDTLSDGDEVNTHSTDPLDTDSDDDGLDDSSEVALVFDPNDPDTDGDGYCDGPSDPGGGACPAGVSDNCPADSNPSQTNSDVFAAGDLCQCGNVDGVGGIDATDLQRAREYVVGAPPGGAFDLNHCGVNGDAACDVADLFSIERAARGASVTLQDRCAAYKGP